MWEHGVLDCVLLIYEDGLRRLDSRQDFDPAELAQSAQIVRPSSHRLSEERV